MERRERKNKIGLINEQDDTYGGNKAKVRCQPASLDGIK